jgi:hypothetical protein
MRRELLSGQSLSGFLPQRYKQRYLAVYMFLNKLLYKMDIKLRPNESVIGFFLFYKTTKREK